MKTWALSAFFVSALALAAHADVAVSGGRTDFLAVSHSAKGRAVLRCHFEKASAAIVVFGDFGNTRKVPES